MLQSARKHRRFRILPVKVLPAKCGSLRRRTRLDRRRVCGYLPGNRTRVRLTPVSLGRVKRRVKHLGNGRIG